MTASLIKRSFHMVTNVSQVLSRQTLPLSRRHLRHVCDKFTTICELGLIRQLQGGKEGLSCNHFKITVIMGDLMMKQNYLHWKLARDETFHGTNVNVMKHCMKQCLTTMTDWLILHVEMNNASGTEDEKEIMKGTDDIVKLHVKIVQTRKLLYHCWELG